MEEESRINNNTNTEDLALSCTICTRDAVYTGRNIVFTKLLLQHFVSSKEKELFRPLKIFDFCPSCIQILNDLRAIETELEELTKKLKRKKTEIKIRILQNCKRRKYNGVFETFRRISTKDFCPRVQMSKNNKLYRQNEPTIQTRHLNNDSPEDTLLLSSSEEECLPQSDSPLPERVPGSSITTDDDKIRPEIISIHPEESLSLFVEETIAKFEPWNEVREQMKSSASVDTIRIDNYCDTTTTIEEETNESPTVTYSNGINNNPEVITIPGDDETLQANAIALNPETIKQSCFNIKPNLSYCDLISYAILCSDNSQVKLQDVYRFIEDTFPYYKSAASNNNWREEIKFNLRNSRHFYKSAGPATSSNILYGLRYSADHNRRRRSLSGKLQYYAKYMEHPYRIPKLQELIMKTSSKTDGVLIISRLCQPGVEFQNTEVAIIWREPPLSISQLGFLAIVNSPARKMDLKDILIFIIKNFPYYEDFQRWTFTLKYYIGLYPFIHLKEYTEDGQILCSIVPCDEYYKNLKLISEILMSPTMTDHMAFSGLIVTLMEAVIRELRISELPSETKFTAIPLPSTSVNNYENINIKANETVRKNKSPLAIENFPGDPAPVIPSFEDVQPIHIPGPSHSNPIRHITLTWPKPLLNIELLCILAILNSKNMCLTIQDIQSFINENFPFYKIQIKHRLKIKLALDKPLFKKPITSTITIYDERPTSNDIQLHFYELNDEHITEELRLKLFEILSSSENVASMAFPDRLATFAGNVWKRRLNIVNNNGS